MRDILHCDLNNFYASCETLINPELKDKPVAVGGDPSNRHGVVVASNYKAKQFGVRCGVTVYQAYKLCPDIIICPPNFKLYNQMSQKVRDIYAEYTDQIEIFSIDECWLDVTHSKMFGTPKQIADIIRRRVREEIGLTISVGVSFTKTFAKIGSDLKKPDATTEISFNNYKDIVWKLPISDMFGVGKQMQAKLYKMGINTIGDLANFNMGILVKDFGKVGEMLYNNANGNEDDPVAYLTDEQAPKSVGNSTTFYKDLTDIKDIELGLTVIAESVVARMINYDIKCAKVLSLVVKDSSFQVYQKQCQLNPPCADSKIYTQVALDLFNKNFQHLQGIRLLGISVTDWCDEGAQISLFDNPKPKKSMDKVMLNIRNKFGAQAIVRGNTMLDDKISQTFAEEHLDKHKKH